MLVLVVVLLHACMSFYVGNIQTNEQALQSTEEKFPVTVRVTSIDGTRTAGIHIDTAHFDSLSQAGVHNARYISTAVGALSPEERERSPFQGGDTVIAAINSPEALSIPRSAFSLTEGVGFDFFESDSPLCVVDGDYADKHGLSVGDEISLPIYLLHWGAGTYHYLEIGDVALEIVGVFDTAQSMGDPSSLYVPVAWLRKAAEAADVPFTYSAFSAEVDRPLTQLNAFKAKLRDMKFYEPNSEFGDPYAGEGVSVEDEYFIKTVQELRQTLHTYRSFLVPFFLLIAVLTFLVVFLVLRSSRYHIAVASSLGAKRSTLFLIYFLYIVLLFLLGSGISAACLQIFVSLPFSTILIVCGSFFLCASIGALSAIGMLLRFDAMELLTKAD